MITWFGMCKDSIAFHCLLHRVTPMRNRKKRCIASRCEWKENYAQWKCARRRAAVHHNMFFPPFLMKIKSIELTCCDCTCCGFASLYWPNFSLLLIERAPEIGRKKEEKCESVDEETGRSVVAADPAFYLLRFRRTCSGELMTTLRSNSNPNVLTCGFRLQHILAGRSFFFSHSCVERERVFHDVVVLVPWHTLQR